MTSCSAGDHMIELKVRNVHEALPRGLALFREQGVRRDSRNGPVLQLPEPLITTYERPWERVMFHPWRDANPFFHFYESLWMLAGRNDVAPLVKYAKQMAEYSDDGKTLNAAYGYRWRNAISVWFQHGGPIAGTSDQLVIISDRLRGDKGTRQCVLQIWDHDVDLGTKTKDHACNLSATFQVGVSGKLDMVVFCRSNDMLWGGWGANAVHFSMLHEYVSARAGLEQGTYSQISVNAHVYLATLEKLSIPDPVGTWSYGGVWNEPRRYQPYEACWDSTDGVQAPEVAAYPIAQIGDDFANWDHQCCSFVTVDGRCSTLPFGHQFFDRVAAPIVRAHDRYKDGKMDAALSEIETCEASDWRKACKEWLQRRIK